MSPVAASYQRPFQHTISLETGRCCIPQTCCKVYWYLRTSRFPEDPLLHRHGRCQREVGFPAAEVKVIRDFALEAEQVETHTHWRHTAKNCSTTLREQHQVAMRDMNIYVNMRHTSSQPDYCTRFRCAALDAAAHNREQKGGQSTSVKALRFGKISWTLMNSVDLEFS